MEKGIRKYMTVVLLVIGCMAKAGISRASKLSAVPETMQWQEAGKKRKRHSLNRLVKYKENHLLFLSGFRVHYSNNMSEKDLRICKNRDKMAGGFRDTSGREMYCRIMGFIETVKHRGLNCYKAILFLTKKCRFLFSKGRCCARIKIIQLQEANKYCK